MGLLNSGDYNAIRKVLDVTLDADALADDVIALPSFLGAAELRVAARAPESQTTQDATKLAHYKLAVTYLAAALLAPALPVLVSEATPDYTYRRHEENPLVRADALRAQFEVELAAGMGDVPDLGTHFTMADGERAYSDTPRVSIPLGTVLG